MMWHTADEDEHLNREKEKSLRYGDGKATTFERVIGKLEAPGSFRVMTGLFLVIAGLILIYCAT